MFYCVALECIGQIAYAFIADIGIRNSANNWCILTGQFIWPSSNLLPAHKCGDRLQCSLFLSLLYKRVLYCEVVNKHHTEGSGKATPLICRYSNTQRFECLCWIMMVKSDKQTENVTHCVTSQCSSQVFCSTSIDFITRKIQHCECLCWVRLLSMW